MKVFIIQLIEFLSDNNLSIARKVSFLIRYLSLLMFLKSESGFNVSLCPDNKPFYYTGIHKNVVMDHLISHISSLRNYYDSESVIIDVGASFGTFPRIANTYYPGIKAYCIEMAKISFDILQKNISSYPNIKAFRLAIGGKRGSVNYNFDASFPEGAFVTKSKTSETVKMSTLDSFVKNNRLKKVTLVKIDTEGHEFQVLLGAKQVLKMASCFIIETGLDRSNFEKVLKIMWDNNFRLVNFGETNTDLVNNRVDSCDLVFKKYSTNEKN